MIVSKSMAKLFYEQCAGTYSGHMADIPNNPMLFGICAAHSETQVSYHSMTRSEFVEFLQETVKQLEE